jgi:hypothetical protein
VSLVQIVCKKGQIRRVPQGETPVVELHLEDNQTVVSFELEKEIPYSQRKTVDWSWKAMILTRL